MFTSHEKKEGYQDRFSKDEAGLRRLRCEVNFGGFVWVNLCDQPIAFLDEWVGNSFDSINDAIKSEPLTVFHYHKEFVDKHVKESVREVESSKQSI